MPTLYRIDCEHAAHDEQAAAMLAAQTRRGYYCDLYPVLVPDRLACELTLGVFRNAACDEPACDEPADVLDLRSPLLKVIR